MCKTTKIARTQPGRIYNINSSSDLFYQVSPWIYEGKPWQNGKTVALWYGGHGFKS